MRIVVTGITSFLGSNTAKQLLQAGHEVFGVVRPSSRNISAVKLSEWLDDSHILRMDFDDIPSFESAGIRESCLNPGLPNMDCWIHFAWDGIGSAGRSNKSIQIRNFQNAQKAYTIATEIGCRSFLFAGSQAEYGKGNEFLPEPISEYGKYKYSFGLWASERAENALGPEYIHMRIYSVYGPGDFRDTLVNSAIRTFLAGNTLQTGPCTQLWNYLFIDDLAEAITRIAEYSFTKPAIWLDIASESGKPLKEYIEEIRTICGGRGCIQFAARSNNAEGDVNLLPHGLSLLSQTGYKEKVPFRKGIERTIEAIKTGEQGHG